MAPPPAPVTGTYLRVTLRLRLRGRLSLQSILIVRDSPGKILGGSFLQLRLAPAYRRVFQCATNTIAPPLPTRQLLPSR